MPGATLLRNNLVLLGGETDRYANDVWYSPDGGRWLEDVREPIWTGRHDHATVVFQDKLWVLGGYRSYLDTEQDLYIDAAAGT